MQPEMTLRDHFAAAALTGLLCNGDYSMEAIPRHAFTMADAMLRCRAASDCPGQDNAPNHDAAPAARADLPDERPPNAVSANGGTPCAASLDGSGTGDTPATHATRGEGSEQSECTQPSAASAGSVAGEPVAWAVMVAGQRMYVSWCKEMCEEQAYYHGHPCGDSVSVVPLYRQPQDGVVRLPPLDPSGAPGWNAAIGAVREALADAGVDWDTE